MKRDARNATYREENKRILFRITVDDHSVERGYTQLLASDKDMTTSPMLGSVVIDSSLIAYLVVRSLTCYLP